MPTHPAAATAAAASAVAIRAFRMDGKPVGTARRLRTPDGPRADGRLGSGPPAGGPSKGSVHVPSSRDAERQASWLAT